jgi:hypothetical protein
VRRSALALAFFAIVAMSAASLGIARATDPPAPSPAPPAKVVVPAKPAPPTASPSPSPTPGPPYANMVWREVGPATAGGRIAAVAGSATDPSLYYVGSAGGGVWKSANGGQTWSAVFEKQKVAAIGAVVIDPTDNKTIWVGTGEANPRNDVSYGDGVYKTTDGGKTWTNMGLPNSRQISRIVIDPRDHNRVIVAVCRSVDRRFGLGDEPAEPKRDLRGNVAVPPGSVEFYQRRSRRRIVSLDRRWRNVD